jgi:hypothetical protein
MLQRGPLALRSFNHPFTDSSSSFSLRPRVSDPVGIHLRPGYFGLAEPRCRPLGLGGRNTCRIKLDIRSLLKLLGQF